METVDDTVSEDKCRYGFQRCQEFLGGAWKLATIDQYHMEYIRYAEVSICLLPHDCFP